MASQSVCCLLDFDGVILAHPKLKAYQSRKSAKFVQKHTHMPYRRCEELNDAYYKEHGHTVTVLNKVFGKPVTLEEYNEYVFQKEDLVKLSRVLDGGSGGALEFANGFNRVLDHCTEYGLDCGIFSNAGPSWISYFSGLAGLRIDEEMVVTPRTTEFLKPKEAAYDRVEQHFTRDASFLFFDDCALNLEVPMQRPNWVPFLFEQHDTADTVIASLSRQCDVLFDHA
jgi:FMN phosphatase YigB (HAD superfamily)